MYKTHFKKIGFNYSAKKGLDLDLWAESIIDGCRPDFFTLFALNALLETHVAIHISRNKIWTLMSDPPDDHDLLLKRCEYHLVFLSRGNCIELVERQQPLIIVESNEDIKTVEVGCLTFDEDEMLNSVIYRGLGRGLDPMEVKKKQGIPFHKDIIKKEPSESVDEQEGSMQTPQAVKQEPYTGTEIRQVREEDDNQININVNIPDNDELEGGNTMGHRSLYSTAVGQKETINTIEAGRSASSDYCSTSTEEGEKTQKGKLSEMVTTAMKETKDKTDDDKSKDDLPESHQRDVESMLMKQVLKVNLIRLETDETGTVIMTKDSLEKLKSPNDGYDSDETIIYYPGREVKPKKPKLLGEECGKLMPTVVKQLIRAHPSKTGFQISLHGIRQKKKRTYVGCRIPGCKLRFPSVREWNSHHRLIHKGFHLSCDKCKKSFNTPSFLRDHAYLHSKVSFKCKRCDKTFAFRVCTE